MSLLNDIRWTLRFWDETWHELPLVYWWEHLPLGYAELHVAAEASREEVKQIIEDEWGYRLPTDPRERAMRIAMLLESHCTWQKMTRCHTQRPHITTSKCRRCSPKEST